MQEITDEEIIALRMESDAPRPPIDLMVRDDRLLLAMTLPPVVPLSRAQAEWLRSRLDHWLKTGRL